ncbi:MAG TPA: PAS domain-containing protein [Rhodopila sp.]|nr:PAS domain-containing protein [Rhodopila sp.]
MAHESHILNLRSAGTQMRETARVYRELFERAPIPLAIVTPDLRIADANDAYLAATAQSRDALAGVDFFVAFPDNPHDPAADGVAHLRSSFERVLRTTQPDIMPLQRYDIKPDNAPWEIRYWAPRNWAVIGENGSVTALVHHVTDVTAATRLSLARKPPHAPGTADVLAQADTAVLRARYNAEEARRDLAIIRAQMNRIRKSNTWSTK